MTAGSSYTRLRAPREDDTLRHNLKATVAKAESQIPGAVEVLVEASIQLADSARDVRDAARGRAIRIASGKR